MAMFAPTCIRLLTSNLGRGKTRNFGFACLGLAQPLGLQVGLILAGVLDSSKVSESRILYLLWYNGCIGNTH
jgi:hypothetical protein